jgi:TetR/AcrR family transcriptional repressor of nem operon
MQKLPDFQRRSSVGHSQLEKASSREKILFAASQKIRETGLEGFSIADVMRDAQLTHGGFYGHFSSRSELVAAALDHALHESELVYDDAARPSLKAIVNGYLSVAHRDSVTQSCAVSTLASEVVRADEQTRAVMDTHLSKYQEKISEAIDGTKNCPLAGPLACTMIGALTLSRLISDEKASTKVLKQAREFILSAAEKNSD